MISVRRWQMRGFLSAMALLLVVQALFLSFGTLAVLRFYHRLELARLEAQARDIILRGVEGVEEAGDAVGHDGPFFVFSADREFIYSNRGRGRSLAPEEYRPIEYDGTVVGYFYADEIRFLSSEANRFFFASLLVLVGGSMTVGFLIARGVARRYARTIDVAFSEVRQKLHELRALRPVALMDASIEEFRLLSQTLHDVSGTLADQEAYKRRWMQDIAHDLRTPLTGLRSQLEGLVDGVLAPESRRFARMLGEVERLESMVASISELHALETQREIERSPIEAMRFAEGLRQSFQSELDAHKARLELAIEVAEFHANEPLLTRAVSNIIANALRHGESGVIIVMRVAHAADQLSIEISNNGPSIPPDQLPRVFERFFRGEYGRSTGGSGLGLSIAEEIAVLHGGGLSAENLTPRGVRFTIVLRETR